MARAQRSPALKPEIGIPAVSLHNAEVLLSTNKHVAAIKLRYQAASDYGPDYFVDALFPNLDTFTFTGFAWGKSRSGVREFLEFSKVADLPFDSGLLSSLPDDRHYPEPVCSWTAVAGLRVAPVVGMGATYSIGSDDYPMTIVDVSRNGKLVIAQKDQARGSLFVPDDEGVQMAFTLRSDGQYLLRGKRYGSLHVGRRFYNLNPSF